MKELTKAEEQVMQVIWKLEKAFLKDIVEAMPDPKPAYTTVSTVIRVLVKKGYIGFHTYGKVNEYHPLILKGAYSKTHIKNMLNSFYDNSFKRLTASFAGDESLGLQELEEIRQMIDGEIKKRKGTDD